MNDGWIKLHRRIKNHWIFKNPEYLKAWITIILECNHKDNKTLIKGELLDCKRGQSLNSLKTWASLFGTRGWSMQVTRSYFALLRKDGMINTEGLKYTTRLTILNYDSYQYEQQAGNKLVTSCQQADNNKQEALKNEKKEKNNKILFGEFVFLTKEEHKKLVDKYEPEFTDACIERLDNYIGSNGKKYKSHYRTILSWVASAEMKTGDWVK